MYGLVIAFVFAALLRVRQLGALQAVLVESWWRTAQVQAD